MIYSELWNIRAKWHNFGVALKIHPGELEAFHENHKHSNTTEKCLFEVIKKWLHLKKPTPASVWGLLAEALEEQTVGEQHLAETLRKKGSYTVSSKLYSHHSCLMCKT